MRAAFFWLLLIALIGLWYFMPPETIRISDARVKDGDTIILGGAAYRLDGIDAPEYHQPCTDAAGIEWACGKAARTHLAALVTGCALECKATGSDRYGRKVATCIAGTISDLSEAMVTAGFALGDGAYDDAQASAKAAKRGIWAGTFTTPADWRAAHPRKDLP